MWDLLRSLKERYGDKLYVSVVDTRNPLALWDVFRYWAWSPLSTWILNHKKVFEGIPEVTEMEHLIDVELSAAATDKK